MDQRLRKFDHENDGINVLQRPSNDKSETANEEILTASSDDTFLTKSVPEQSEISKYIHGIYNKCFAECAMCIDIR